MDCAAGPDILGLAACVDDARRAALNADTGPADPTEFHSLRGRLEASRNKLPPLYQQTVFEPFVRSLDELGPVGFNQVLLRDPRRERSAGLMLDIAQAILQNGEGFQDRATDAFQEVVSDLYDGFLSAEDRRGVHPPDHGVVPAVVKWGRPDFGPYTWTVTATSVFGLQAAVVSLPPANARSGLLAWAALGHETAGHDVIHADDGLSRELTNIVFDTLNQRLNRHLARYWSDRIDETASDVLGILNMGYAAGIGLVGYFRGLNAAFAGVPKLRSEGPSGDPHPADVLRGFLAAETVRLLEFEGSDAWADVIQNETSNDAGRIVLAEREVSKEDARTSANLVAQALVGERVRSLENHALGDIQNWRDIDESAVHDLCVVLTSASDLPTRYAEGIYAAHVVAAATRAGLRAESDLGLLFDRMLGILDRMHSENPSWGPLFVSHPGNISTHRTYIPQEFNGGLRRALFEQPGGSIVGRSVDRSVLNGNGPRKARRSQGVS